MRNIRPTKAPMFCSFSSARRKEPKEASTYPKPFPIWKGVAENRRNRDFQSFGIARKACALKGERWRFYLEGHGMWFYIGCEENWRGRGEYAFPSL